MGASLSSARGQYVVIFNASNALGDGGGEASDDASVGGEEVIAGHTGLAGDTGGDDNNVDAADGISELLLANKAAGLQGSKANNA